MLVTAFHLVQSEGYQEPHSDLGSQSTDECVSKICIGTLPFLSETRYPTTLLSPETYNILLFFRINHA